jgi:predicted Zn-dependent peptidase
MYKKTTFPNGLRLITVPTTGTSSASVFVIFGVGSRYERRDINGASHFIEHLMFKGTDKRPTTLDISKSLDSVGAEFNAATSKDWTGYYVKIDAKKIELAVDVLSDMLYHSKFDNEEINRERGVIVEEINMYHDNPIMYIEDVAEQLLFPDSTLGWEIAGPRELIKKVPRSKMIAYRDAYYVPENTVVVVAGNIDNKITQLIKKYFVTKKVKTSKVKKYSPFKSKQTKPRVKVVYRDTQQVQLALGFPAYSYSDKRIYALYLMAVILGGNMSSRLFISVRERKGLAYFVRSYPNVYQDTGDLIIQSGLDKARLEEAIHTILDELKKMRAEGVTEDELVKAKDYMRGKMVLTLEDTSSLADWYAKQEILENSSLTPEKKLAMLDRVTTADVKKVAKDLFQKNKINLAIIGPYKNGKVFNKLFDL